MAKRLELIVDSLAENFNAGEKTSQKPRAAEPEYLERHLLNASKVLGLMRTGAKPLLVIMTDATCSLMARSSSSSKSSSKRGNLNTVISKLHSTDTKIITVDLGDENRVANTLGYVNHDEHLKYLAYVTCGAHFDYSTLL